MSGKITVIRHAPTEYNENQIFMGTLDIPVINFDESQIAAVKVLVEKENYTAIYSSPLKRALQTAEKICGTKNKILLDTRLIERNLGDWQGEKKDYIRKTYSSVFKNNIMNYYYTPNNGENFKSLITRVADFICSIYIEKCNVLIFTHNGVFRVMKSLLTGILLNKTFSIKEPFLVPQSFSIDDSVIKKIHDNPFYTVDIDNKV